MAAIRSSTLRKQSRRILLLVNSPIISLLTHRLTKDIKVFEGDLKAKADIAIEQLKHSLETSAVEHQVRFSKLHEKRAEVIAELYKRLVEAFWAADSFLSLMEWVGEPNKQEKLSEAETKLREFFILFETQRIYLPEPICALMDKFIADVRSRIIRFGVYVKIANPTEKSETDKMRVWMTAFETFQKEIPEARRALEAEFRSILGGTL